MRIAVCIKQVPDTREVKLDPVTNNIIRDGVPSIINMDDKSGLEMAIQLKEKHGGTVSVFTMGPPQADLALREALAMGCDEAFLISAREFGGSDTYATGYIIATAMQKVEATDGAFDLFITGRQAIDGDTAQVGPQIAENLKVPQVSYAEGIEINGDVVTVKRQYEDRYHIIEVGMPCLLTAIQELAEPRYMHAGLIVDAYNKEIPVIGFNDIKDMMDVTAIGNARMIDGEPAGSPTNVVRSFTKQPKGQGIKYDNVGPDEAVKIIMDKMIERHII